VGDVKPMIDSLLTTTGKKELKDTNKKGDTLFELIKLEENKTALLSAIKSTRQENKEKNLIKQMSKSIPKQSIRMKKS